MIRCKVRGTYPRDLKCECGKVFDSVLGFDTHWTRCFPTLPKGFTSWHINKKGCGRNLHWTEAMN